MTDERLQLFAEAWYAAWNSHNLDAILEHYAEDVVFISPFVKHLVGEPDGEMRGRAELRHYFARALVRYPDLKFTPITTAPGVNSIVLVYKSVSGLLAAEMMRFGSNDRVVEVRCHYTEVSNFLENWRDRLQDATSV